MSRKILIIFLIVIAGFVSYFLITKSDDSYVEKEPLEPVDEIVEKIEEAIEEGLVKIVDEIVEEVVLDEKPAPVVNEPKQVEVMENSKEFIDAHNRFSFDIFGEIFKEVEEENIFISPTSMFMAMSMVYNGARGKTKEEIGNALQLQNINIEDINNENNALINNVKNSESIDISLANSIWINKDNQFSLNRDFKDITSTYFEAEYAILPFSLKSTADRINKWASDNTNGLIKKVVDDPLDSELIMFLINAIYFKGDWENQFNKSLTKERDFHLADGSVKQHPMMHIEERFPYFETEDFQSVKLPYKNNGKEEKSYMYVFLPNDINEFIGTINEENWNKWNEQYTTEYPNREDGVDLYLPKFDLTFGRSLIESFKKLGVKEAFIKPSADFSGIGSSSLGNLFIGILKQDAVVKVNEEGTEAAAVTTIGFGIESDYTPRYIQMNVNKPFFFAITKGDVIMFMGVLQNPE